MELIPAKTIISGYMADNAWFGNNYTMNIYKGCCHGCIYCDSRSECYRIENFDEVRAKADALGIIRRELAAKRRTGVVGTGAMSDPYNPWEKEHCLTRGALELLHVYRFGVSVATKSNLVARDIDVLKLIKSHSPVLIKITVTIADDLLCRKVEPHAPAASQRFAAIRQLADNGVFAGILLMPVLPFLADSKDNVRDIIRLAYKNGAKFIYPEFGVTLRQNQRQWYFEKLDTSFPGIKEKYIDQFGNAYMCPSPKAKSLWQLLQKECDKLGILYRMPDIITAYKQGYGDRQISLF